MEWYWIISITGASILIYLLGIGVVMEWNPLQVRDDRTGRDDEFTCWILGMVWPLLLLVSPIWGGRRLVRRLRRPDIPAAKARETR